MKLIADSGSTKTDWTLIHDADWRSDSIIVASFSTQGITPIHQSPADIRQILGQEESAGGSSAFQYAGLFLW